MGFSLHGGPRWNRDGPHPNYTPAGIFGKGARISLPQHARGTPLQVRGRRERAPTPAPPELGAPDPMPLGPAPLSSTRNLWRRISDFGAITSCSMEGLALDEGKKPKAEES